jgi:signal transduction histidine kinase
MLKRYIETVARGRFMLPLVAVFAFAGVAINESTYRNARNGLDGGIALTDARVKSAAVLQALSDHEMATRQYLITGQPTEAERQHSTAKALTRVQTDAFDSVARLDAAGLIATDKLRSLIEEQRATFDGWLQMAARGRLDDALRASVADDSRRRHDELRSEFNAVLQRAADVQQTGRASLYDALMLNRVAIHLLMALAVIALFLFTRQLIESDRHEAQEQQHLTVLVNERTAQLRELAGHLVTAREGERARVARELHDELGGLLTSMKLEFARLRRVTDMPQSAGARLATLETRLNEGIALKRRIIENLHPSSLDQLGLVSALEMLCSDVAESLGVPVHTRLAEVNVGKDVELTIYRLVQESLTNISKYAQCREVTVSLRTDADRVQVEIEDDGRGFDSTSVKLGSHGLLGMRVRVESHAGTLSIRSAPGRGTSVKAELPVATQAARHV